MTQLRVSHLSKEFGGIHAIEDLTFNINVGTIHSIIGPNGAGKTTLLNLLTGVYRPTHGRILLYGERVEGMPSHALAVRGMARTFQNLQIFFNMTALENVMVGRHRHLDRRLWHTFLRLPSLIRAEAACRDYCAALMEFVGCGQYIGADASSMPYGALKRLEIARALASGPRLLLLDEPAAGLNSRETAEIDDVIRKTAAEGVTVVLVEHDMKMVMGISDHVLVLNYGRKLAEGTPTEVCADKEVVAAYLGAD
ncbi:branched chain amino acid/phenylalanine ABC transporter ATP binding subunit LivG [uncultured Gammaproteobacteria bacterium]